MDCIKQYFASHFSGMRLTDLLVAMVVVLKVATGSVSAEPQQNCVDCHRQTNKTMVLAWQESRHAAVGVGCADCHGDNHSTIFNAKGKVSAAKCGNCHAQQVNEFNRSLHAEAIDRMESDPKFKRLSPAMAGQGCVSCHKIGEHFADGSRGSCNSCHSGHAFSVVEARRPESCGGCHSGPDHPHIEMWQASKHGQLYASEKTRAQSPTCVTCHMSRGSHDTSIGLGLGNVGTGAALDTEETSVQMRSISAEEVKKQRSLMLANCLTCHSSRFASESLASADLVKKEADSVLGEAAGVINQLQSESLIKWLASTSPSVAKPNSPDRQGAAAATSKKSQSSKPLPGTEMPYDGLSPIEQRFFEMVKFHHASTFKGAYHHSPVFTHNEGFLRMQQDLSDIKDKAEHLRNQARKP
ncbi:MAG: putative periplasmic multiheme cytochrome c [Verrucomicrobiaceae bacterium]|nr:putative periplasmic multiheme cytochrome c [Verrucomicrobiaceae bacterium]